MRKIEYNISYTKMVDNEAWERVKEADIDNDISFADYIDIIKAAFDIDVPLNGEWTAVCDDDEVDNVILEM